MEKLLTTRDVAAAIGASESSLRRWTDSGAIRTSRTVGGHRRIPLSEAIRFIRDSRATVIRPEVLGLPATSASDPLSPASTQKLAQTLKAGNAEEARGQIIGLYLGGASLAQIFDGPMQQSLRELGELWRHDARGILIEHRATDVCLAALGQLRQLLPTPAGDAPVAVGGTPPGDRYLLASMMAGIVLADAGFRDINFGPETPLDSLATAAEDHKATLVWLSVGLIDNKPRLRRDVDRLIARLSSSAAPAHLALGGRAAGDLRVKPSPRVNVLRSMAELVAFAQGLIAVRPKVAAG